MHLDRKLQVIGHRVLRLARNGRDGPCSCHLDDLDMLLRVLSLVATLRPMRLSIVIARVTLNLSQVPPDLLRIIIKGPLGTRSTDDRVVASPLLLFDL